MKFSKVKFTHKAIRGQYLTVIAILSSMATLASLFIGIPDKYKFASGIGFIIFLGILYICLWIWANTLKERATCRFLQTTNNLS